MRIRVHLRAPAGEPVVRDIVDGLWADPTGDPDGTIGQSSYALPGLVDSHAHFAAPIGKDWKTDPYENAVDRAEQALASGVLLALDKGWSNLNTVQLIESIDPALRPEIEAAGIINAVEGGYWPDFARELTRATFDDGIRQSAEEGSGWVKLVGDWPRRGQGPVANFDEGQLRRAVELAGESGARVAIHTMAREVPGMAVRAGIHSIEHGLFLSEEDLALLGSRGGMWVPTIIRMEAVVAQLGENSSGGKLLVEGLDNVRRLMPAAAEAGVHLLAGTDVTVGAHDVALEALKMVDFGLPVDRALDAVSVSGYEATGRSSGFDVGAPANAVLFGDDPLHDISVLGRPEFVIRLGEVRG
ncbi:MAG: amidohydrolase family protein [Acidimicrobiia bacterium]